MNSSGLQFTSMTELLATCSLTEQQTRQFEQKSLDVVYQSLKNLQGSAEKARGDLEQQYRLLMKAGELGNIITKSSKFARWKQNTANAALFYADFEKVVREASNLQSVLNIKYENLVRRADTQKRAEQEAADKRAATITVDSTMRAVRAKITPRELVRKVENDTPKKSALIFDIRQNQSDAIFYNRSEMITVIQVPYDMIDSSLTFASFRTNLAVTQRALLARLSTSDYVVLMDDDGPELVNTSPLPKSKMSFLFKALTQYNQSERLRERPMFMEGGFKMWKAQYPTYTKNEQPVTPRSIPSDELDDVISAYHRNYPMISEIRYPDLNTMRPEPTAQTPPAPAAPPAAPALNRQSTIPPVAMTQRPMIPPSLPSSTPPAPLKPVAPPTPPIFPLLDRTSKPSTLPERPIDPSPTRQNGGGEVKRPPLLDRATKPNAQNAQTSKQHEAQLLSIYDQMDMAIHRVVDDSTRNKGRGVPGAVGLFNMGNTCFMSATLQCLFQTPGLAEVFTKKVFVSKVNTQSRLGSKGVISAGFASLSDMIWNGTFTAIRPSRFLQLFSDTVYQPLSDGRQHDASEFQIFLLDALHEDTNQAQRISFEQNYHGGAGIAKEAADFLKKHYQFSLSPVNRLLGSITVSEIRCLTCGASSATFEENTIISVEIPSNSSCSLDMCLRSHFSQTKLDGDSRWNCPKCKEPRASTRTSKLWQPPPVMIIHLKRFALFNGDFEKNTAAVTFETARFDVRPYLHEMAPAEKPVYKLYAATLHNGRLNSGHYTAVASHLRSDKWLRFDDSVVTPCENFKVDPSLAYILFYKRC
ncbi:ubiquitinyl hydrolase 1 [Caenorhabditis elegans]|uniref:ubiquitinyl hydrolase 1 n=2 Tax=Caenorhabditis elegans TaxID=6239 RepID=G5EBW2_CAEEL|nr:USP domain-containing protein [Caenorhabditis elegans]CAB05712.2 USP domain-containing protein [Caenorhabditis elegans]|eukprot:NP_507513.2 Ubiquitin Specific Protease [Caenorhabditis elegans]